MKPATAKERLRQAMNAAGERATAAYAYGHEERSTDLDGGGRAVQHCDGRTVTTTIQLASGRLVELSRTVGATNGAGTVNRDVRLAPPLGKNGIFVTPKDSKGAVAVPGRGRVNGASLLDRSGAVAAVAGQAGYAPKLTRRRLYWMRGRARQLTAQHPRSGPVQYLQDRAQRACGLCRRADAQISVVVSETGSACFAGVQHCGSAWLCPGCRMVITAGRADEVRQVVEGHGGERAYLLTLTVSHDAGDDLAPLRRGESNAYRGMCRGAPWTRIKQLLGLQGSIRAMELTHGRNGWHPHLHVLLLVKKPLSLTELKRAEHRIGERWANMVERYLGAEFRPSMKHGADVQQSHKAEYISKLGLELADPGTKQGRAPGHRTPMQILADVCDNWNERDARLWREYVAGIKGAQQLTWSRGLKARHGVIDRSDAELTDDEVANEGSRIVGVVEPDLWRGVQRHPGADVWLLEQTEKGGSLGLAKAIRLMRARLSAAS